jgi:hypothetical protein
VTRDDDGFIRELTDRLAADPQVVGLVLAGSSADTGRRDEWSDHDFLLITEDGTPEGYRTDLSWLPDPAGIAYSLRETAHGLKTLYRSGLLIEYAVLDRAQFADSALNHYAVVIDAGGVSEMARAIHARSMQPPAVDRLAEFRNLLSLIYIAVGRSRRGERLSADGYVRHWVVEHLLRLLGDLLPSGVRKDLDVLDVWRRFETASPVLAREIDDALALPVEDAARALLDLADRELTARWTDYPAAETELIRTLLGW